MRGCGDCFNCWWIDFLRDLTPILVMNKANPNEYPEEMMSAIGLPNHEEQVTAWTSHLKDGFNEALDAAIANGGDEEGPLNAAILMGLAFGIRVGREIAARENAEG